jgi:hypothetical protein
MRLKQIMNEAIFAERMHQDMMVEDGENYETSRKNGKLGKGSS